MGSFNSQPSAQKEFTPTRLETEKWVYYMIPNQPHAMASPHSSSDWEPVFWDQNIVIYATERRSRDDITFWEGRGQAGTIPKRPKPRPGQVFRQLRGAYDPLPAATN